MLITVIGIQYNHLFDGKYRETLEEVTKNFGGNLRVPCHTLPQALGGRGVNSSCLATCKASYLKINNII